MNHTENGHNHITTYIKAITPEDLQASDHRMLASSMIDRFKYMDRDVIGPRGVSLLIPALRDREEDQTIEDKKLALYVAAIAWQSINPENQEIIITKLHEYTHMPTIDTHEMQRIKERLRLFVEKIKTLPIAS